jgi:hypothetical protein
MTHPLDPKALEAAARALCLKAGNDPDLMRGDGTANWTYYRPHTSAAVSAYLDATGDGWMQIETAPKTDAATMRAIPFLGWCLDGTSHIGGDIRVIWWEPTMQRADETKPRARWYGDRDMEEHPVLWRPLPAPPALAAQEKK